MINLLKNAKWLVALCAVLPVLIFSGCTEEGFVADKVSVMGVEIGSMSREEAIGALENVVLDESKTAVINADGESIVLSAGEIGAKYDTEKTVDEIIEKNTGVFSGWFKKDYPMMVDVNEGLLDRVLADFEVQGAPLTAQIVEEGIMVKNAYPSKTLDREELTEKLAECFGTENGEAITMSYSVSPVKGMSNSEFLSTLGDEFKESEYMIDEEGQIYVTESAVGVIFDMDKALGIMAEHSEEGEEFLIPCEVKKPKHTKEELEAALFRDTLGTYTTSYTTSSSNRSSNIALATSAIDGLVLMPGEEFSFNTTVGERTVERGYKTAGAYVAGETVDQVGGGICQVSSTLYNSVLLSNLEITSRRSHQMTVSYVPVGRDATVNWGTTDFKFKNNTEYPIKLVGKTQNKRVTLTVIGTETIENKEVKILTSTVSVLSPAEVYEEDPLLPVGETKTKKGSSGYVVDAVRVVYSGDTEVSRETLVRSRYNPKNTVITVGTMVVEAPTENAEEMPQWLKPAEPAKPVDGEIQESETGI